MRITAVLGAAATIAALVAMSCDAGNPRYCDATTTCPGGQTCDPVAHQCGPTLADLSGADFTPPPDLAQSCMPNCVATGATPFCDVTTCRGCHMAGNPALFCSGTDATRPFCLTSGPDIGTCVQCTQNSECTNANQSICDQTRHNCRRCKQNSECASSVCDQVPTSSTFGQCLPQSAVVYVDVSPPCQDMNMHSGDSPAQALCKINEAVTKVRNNAAKKAIHIATGSYAENVAISAGMIVIVADPGAIVQGVGSEVFTISGSANVTIVGLDLGFVTGNNHHGILCSSTGATLALYNCQVENNSKGVALEGTSCGVVIVDSSRIGPANIAGGIRVGNSYSITNNFIYKNGNTSVTAAGVSIAQSSAPTRLLANNTIVSNTSQTGTQAGLLCNGVVPDYGTLINNILYDNRGGVAVAETTCAGFSKFTAIDDAVEAATVGAMNVDLTSMPPNFVDANNNDYHIMSSSPCKDKGTTTMGAPTRDIDDDPRPDKTTNMADIGADEIP
jgi:hypothetical protein